MVKKIIGCLSCVVILTVFFTVNAFANTSTAYKAINETTKENTISDSEENICYNTCDLMRFFFLPFESGSIDESTSNYGSYGINEVCIGVFSWTTMSNSSGVQYLCGELANLDNEFAGELERFSYWSNQKVITDINSPKSCIVKTFKKLDEIDHHKFLSLQLAIMEKDYKKLITEQGTNWILNSEHSPALIGSYYSMLNWAPYIGWEEAISPEKNDKENLISLYNFAFENISNECMKKRFEQQFVVALDILYEEKDKIDIFLFLKNPEKY